MGRKSRRRSQQRPIAGEPAGGSPPASGHASPPRDARGRIAAAAVCGVLLLLVLGAVWARPGPAEDLFMGLAGGRDVFAGKLGKPDDWSFTTAGRVWLNQNWGFDALMFAAFRAGGEGGLLALKALALLAIAAAAVAAARRRGAGWPSALLVVAAAMAVTRYHMELRAYLATFAMACLLLLVIYESGRRPRLVWLAVPLIAVWANLHGGFMLGFALLGLWVAASAVGGFRAGGLAAALRGSAGPAGALAASLAASATLTPFGIANLTYPLTYLRSPEWRAVSEWQPPSFTAAAGTTSAWELLGVVALVVGGTVWRLLAREDGTGARPEDAATRVRRTVFDAGLAVAVTWMGLSGIRFLPLAAVLLAPLAATQAEVVFRGARPWVPAGAGAVALAAAMFPFAVRTANVYSSANPRFTDESFFLRMANNDRLPSGAAEFLAANDVRGRVFADWPWEGYLRWRCPKLQIFIGGRATQIYDLETLDRYRRFGNDPQPAERLAQWDTHLLVVPLEGQYLHIADVIAFAPGAHWAMVFYDGRTAVLADLSSPATRPLVDRVAGGSARFRTAAVAELSRSLCAITGGVGGDMQAVAALAAANRALPTGAGPWFMLFAARAHHLPPRAVLAAFEREYEALTRDAGSAARRVGSLAARISAAQVLSNLYRSSGQGPLSDQWAATVRRLMPELEAVLSAS